MKLTSAALRTTMLVLPGVDEALVSKRMATILTMGQTRQIMFAMTVPWPFSDTQYGRTRKSSPWSKV